MLKYKIPQIVTLTPKFLIFENAKVRKKKRGNNHLI